MECVNNLITQLDGSLSHTSNVLDNFEHTKCGKLLQTEFHHDEQGNDVADNDTAGDHDTYYASCYSSMWIRSCQEEVIEPLPSSEITGSIPEWLTGTLLRNGPGNLKVGEYHHQHLFDSSALLHKFHIANGNVTYQRRFVQTEVYKRNMAAQRIVFTEFGTCTTPDPCQSIFQRVAAVFKSDNKISDNSMISVHPFGDEYYTFAEAPVMHRIDPKTLETMDRVNISKSVNINIVHHTGHPYIMADGRIYNVGLSVTPFGPRYNVICFYPNRVAIDDSGKERKLSTFDQATIVASVPSRWLLNPSYMHTFGITDNYFIIVEQPLTMSFIGKMITYLKREPIINFFKWHGNKNTLIHIISRKTGQLVRTFIAETFFFFHIINQFETRDGEYVVLDICCYRDPKMLEYMYIDAMKNGNADFDRLFRARPLRFVLPMKEVHSDTTSDYNLITLKTVHQNLEFQDIISTDHKTNLEIVDDADNIENSDKFRHWRDEHSALRKKPIAHLLDGKIFVKPELLCDVRCEIPRINTDFHLGKEYRYFYAISCDKDMDTLGTLIKVDTFQKTKKIWQEKGIYPSEPIFVPNPNGKNEDDGVVVSSMIWTEKENRVGLLILDAVTFMEIARVTFDTPGPVPRCLHGWFSLEK